MKIRAVTFDLWLTLIWDTQELNEYWRLRRLINLHRFVKKRTTDGINFNDVRLAMEEVGRRSESVYEAGRDISPEQRGRMVFDALGVKIPKSEAERVFDQAGKILSRSGYFSKLPNLNVEAEPTLRKLKEISPGIKIALISNAARSSLTYGRMLRAFGIARYFDALTISCEVGTLKPHREIFETTLRALAVEPAEVVHVGDSFKADVVGATSAGMNAALYTGLWHRYAAHHHTMGEHIPRDFKAPRHLIVREIRRLQDVLKIVQGS